MCYDSVLRPGNMYCWRLDKVVWFVKIISLSYYFIVLSVSEFCCLRSSISCFRRQSRRDVRIVTPRLDLMSTTLMNVLATWNFSPLALYLDLVKHVHIVFHLTSP
jgi:hypothetical protein